MSIADVSLALAGIFQSVDLVKQIARQGRAAETPMRTSIESLLKLDAESSAAVYGGVAGVRSGLTLLHDQFGYEGGRRESELFRYAIGVIVLERRLMKNPAMLQQITDGINRAQEQVRLFNDTLHPSVLAGLADVYSRTLSTFSYRIQVQGDPRFLQNPDLANKVRALLLAGVRSAVLWRQKGGSRLQLLLSRGKIVRQTEAYLQTLKGNLSE